MSPKSLMNSRSCWFRLSLKRMRTSCWGLVEVLFENLQEYKLRRVDFTTEFAAWINQIFRLADLLIVSGYFVHTLGNGELVPLIFR